MKNSLMKSFLLSFFFILSACSTHSWAYDFIELDGEIYVITEEVIQSEDIGGEIAKVERYSDDENDYTRSDYINFSNKYKVGTSLFEIKTVSTDVAIAVQFEKDLYIKAIKENE
ncbi:hypothetical protein [Alkalihalobacillus trypoxylicola]|uniref:DUF3221 domain-containing protein n=1 Tax=Alkalihalobacillus trypoxylicola TaxID=519424 RepID=A0A161Q7T0_9BACI|nr:hypothetical protein [Alkalihalobacillus trypoxylicola]KYG33022.1 hypothetical protein AZF04_17840 [Alkalihalobacillus trypoxylicola]GAF66692.1 hypothetical protein BTS2_3594 [Bacillus sp. TS-2]